MNSLKSLAVLAAFAGSLTVACDNSGTTTKPAEAVLPEYGMAPIPGRDAERPETDAGTGAQNEPCDGNEACRSGWCFSAITGEGAPGVCTVTCLDASSCPAGWDCRVVINSGADSVSLCVPPPPDAALDGLPIPIPEAGAGDLGSPADAAPREDLLVVSDMRVLMLDAAVGPDDAAVNTPDAPVVSPGDAAPPPRDAAPPQADAPGTSPPLQDATPQADAPITGPPSPDAAPLPQDAAPLPEDAAPPLPDAPVTAPPPPDAAPPTPDAAPPLPDAAPPVLKGYGEPCMAGAECQSTFCVGDPINGGGFCTQRCNNDAACPELDVCRAAGAAINVCFRNETGTPCNLPNDCVDGICLTPPDGLPWANVQSICVNRCEVDGKCPAGYTCEVIQSNQGPVRACNVSVRRLDTCPDGVIDTCVNSGVCAIPPGRNAIDIYYCIGDQAQPDGYCSCSCRSAADCPSGFGCYREPGQILTADAARPGLCLAFAGYRCPVEASNPNLGTQCPSFTCVTPDSGDFDAYCSSPCLADTDCPAEYTCDEALGGCVTVQ